VKDYYLFLTFYSPFRNNLPISVSNKPDVPSIDKITTILNFMSQEFDAVHLLGGEPFILPFFNDILDFAVDHYSKVYVETMGTGDVFRAAYNIRRHIKDGADIEVLVQLLDMDPAVADKYVGNGSWESAISSASLLKATFDVDPKIVMYIGSHSTHKYRLLADLGFELILRRAYGMKVTERSVANMFQLAEYGQVTVEDCVLSAIKGGAPCVEPKYVLDFDGNIYLSRYYITDELKIGNVFGMTFDDLTNTVETAYQKLQQVKLVGKCSRCAYAEVCMGGDFLFWPSLEQANDQACPVHEEAVVEINEETEEQAPEQIEDEDLVSSEDAGEFITEDEFIESLDE